MQLNLGAKIRELRHRDGRTQEMLADALGVTSQAVSRWESGGSYPDMELMPSIANYFGVTIDELFGYNNERSKKIDEIICKINTMNAQNNGEDINIDECLALAREAMIEFPANEKVMLCLASVLYNAGYVRYGEHHLTDHEGYDIFDVERHRTYTEWSEAIAIYEKIIPILENGSERNTAIINLSHLYANIGEYEKADMLSDTVPDIHCCRDFLQLTTCDGKERAAKFSETILKLLGIAAEMIGDAVAANYENITTKEAEEFIKKAADIFDIVCPDGEYGNYRKTSAYLYLYLSTMQWRNGKHDKAFNSLDKALEHIKKCERFSSNTDMTFGSPLLKNVKLNPKGTDFDSHAAQLPSYWPWICIPDSDDVAVEMQADPRWSEWVKKTQE